MRVLLIEDSVFYQKIFQDFFDKHKIEHLICEHGMYALEALETDIFDVVFLDLKLPDIHGKDLYLEIIETQDTTVIPITGYQNEMSKFDDFLNEFEKYILKPFGEEEIISSLGLEEGVTQETNLKSKTTSSEKSRKDLMDFCSTVGPNLSRQLFDTFIVTLNTKVPALSSLYKQGHFFEIENTVHQLKSNCRYFGFYDFADICESIEHQMVSDPTNMAEGHLDTLLDMSEGIHETLEWARSELSQLQGYAA